MVVSDGNGNTMELRISVKLLLAIAGFSLGLTTAVIAGMSAYYEKQTDAKDAHSKLSEGLRVSSALSEEREKFRLRSEDAILETLKTHGEALQTIGNNVEAIAREQQISRRRIAPMPAGLSSGSSSP